MLPMALLLTISVLGPSRAVAADAAAKPLTLESFVDNVVADGGEGSIPQPIAELIGVTAEIRTLDYRISKDQTTDAMTHGFMVMVERDPSSGEAKPVGLVLLSDQVASGSNEGHWFRASLAGKLEKVVAIQGKRDEQGHSIKGSGTSAEKDIKSSEIKKRFQHELDLWLKKSYLKKEWKSAQFFEGVLKKKS